MIHYTEEERKEIVQLYKDRGIIINDIGEHIVNSFFDNEKCMTYHCPFEDIPLYMNKSPIIASWRLKRGR